VFQSLVTDDRRGHSPAFAGPTPEARGLDHAAVQLRPSSADRAVMQMSLRARSPLSSLGDQLSPCASCGKVGCGCKPVQRKCNQCAESDHVAEAAEPALDHAAAPLPHFERLQAAFGRHDLSDVRTVIGGPARQATESMGADAFTSGSRIGFRDHPDERLAAHEAAHVIQQRAGVSLHGNVGAPGDEHEQHADRVADAVVAGRSAEPILDERAGRASATAVQMDPDPHAHETVPEFARRVRDRAAERLTRNVAVLAQWTAYVRSMEGFQLRAQLLTSVVADLAQTGAATPGGRQRFERYAGSHNAAERGMEGAQLAIDASYRERTGTFMGYLGSMTQGHWTTPSVAERLQVLAGDRQEDGLAAPRWVPPDPRYSEYAGTIERFQTGQQGGCQTCHEINLAWQHTAERWGSPLPRGDAFAWLRERPQSAQDTLFSFAPAPTATTAAPLSPTTSTGFPQVVAPPASTTQTQPNPFLPATILPDAVVMPPARTNLCGMLPAADAAESHVDLASWGPNSAIVANVLARINAVLTPLGPRGYRVLGRRTFDDLWSVTPERLVTVRDEILGQITARSNDYESLRGKIQRGEVPYEELCPIVDELLPTTNASVRAQAEEAVHARQRLEAILTGLELILTGLSFIYPPAIVVTLPAGLALGLVRASLGVEQLRQGQQWSQGIGAGIYSGQQEAEASGLGTRGWINIVSGLFAFAMSAHGLNQMASQAPGAGLRAVQTEAGLMVWHPDRPGYVMWIEGNAVEIMGPSGQVLASGTIVDGRIVLQSGASAGTDLVPAFQVGGARTGVFPPNQYNPCGSGDNCGFTAIARGLEYQNPTLFRNADQLYREQLARLGITNEQDLSQMLVFPPRSYVGLRPRPGYEPLFNTEGNALSEYTLPSVAQSSGLQVQPANFRDWTTAFGGGRTLDEAVEARMLLLARARAPGATGPSEDAVRALLSAQRQQLPGTYIIGSQSQSHFMNLEIGADGRLLGFDPQNLARYEGIDNILRRMGSIDLMVRITPPVPVP
jgi:hypothetical protein